MDIQIDPAIPNTLTPPALPGGTSLEGNGDHDAAGKTDMLAPMQDQPAPAPTPVIALCDWRTCRTGCCCPALPPTDLCAHEGGCKRKFHHACGNECEMAQFKHDDPEGAQAVLDEVPEAKCPYDSNGKKYCMHHHPNCDIFLKYATSNSQTGAPVTAATGTAASAPKSSTSSNVKKKKQPKLTPEQKMQQKQQQQLQKKTAEATADCMGPIDEHWYSRIEWTAERCRNSWQPKMV